MISLLNKFDDNYIIRDEDILEVVSFYLRSNGLENYLKDVKYNTEGPFLAFYSIKNNVIELNNKKIWEYCYKNAYRIVKKYNVDQNYFSYFVNFFYLSIIFHELTHAAQKQKYDTINSDNNLYTYLYDLCKMIGYFDVVFYNNNHSLLPLEIEANNQGLFKAYQLMTYTKLPSKECSVMHLEYLSSLLSNYKRENNRVIAPIEKLNKRIEYLDMDEVKSLLEKTRLSKNQRLNYGLGISTKEYDGINKEKQKILLKR